MPSRGNNFTSTNRDSWRVWHRKANWTTKDLFFNNEVNFCCCNESACQTNKQKLRKFQDSFSFASLYNAKIPDMFIKHCRGHMLQEVLRPESQQEWQQTWPNTWQRVYVCERLTASPFYCNPWPGHFLHLPALVQSPLHQFLTCLSFRPVKHLTL